MSTTEKVTSIYSFVCISERYKEYAGVDGSYGIEFSSNGTSVATVSGQYQITAWDITTMRTLVLNTVTNFQIGISDTCESYDTVVFVFT